MARSRIRFGMRSILALPLVFAALIFALKHTREPVINRVAYEAIEIGMDLDQLELQFGQRGIEPETLSELTTTDVAYVENLHDVVQRKLASFPLRHWKGRRYQISVLVDAEGVVVAKYYERRTAATPLDKIADIFGL